MAGDHAFAAARTMVGTRFRLHGDDPADGLDCVGLIAAAWRSAGRALAKPRGYPMRGVDGASIAAYLRAAGFVPVGDQGRSGDVLCSDMGLGQMHLGMIGPDSIIHAHAGLRRVVETPRAAMTGTVWRLMQQQ